MQCVTPMFRLYNISTGETVRILPRQEVMEGLAMDPNSIRFQLSKMNSRYLARNQLVQTIPCQNCYACKLNKSAEWATRNILETLDHEHNYFITLTYDDYNLPIPERMEIEQPMEDGTILKYNIENDGTWIEGCLIPDHIEKFIKDIRNYFNYRGIQNIRYFYCGEYGETTHRPHYHILLYGLPMDLSQNYSYHIDKNYKEHWKNPIIDKFWPYGMHDIANIEWSSAAYVSRYTMKKIFDEPKSNILYAQEGKIKEYVRMSNRPGIGMKYYKEHSLDIYKNDEMIMKTVKGNTGSFKPPKSFDKLFKEEYPEEWKKIEKKRKECAERSRKNSYYYSNYTDLEKLKMKAESVSLKASQLPRNGTEE